MACVGRHSPDSREAHSSMCCLSTNSASSCTRARRPALVPPNSTLSLAEAETVRTRTQQPLFPPPDPQLSQGFGSQDSTQACSPEPAHSEQNMHHEPGIALREEPLRPGTRTTSHSRPLPVFGARDPRRRSAKARAQHDRNRSLRSSLPGKHDDDTTTIDLPAAEHVRLAGVGPKRKLPAFVQEEEMGLQLEDRVSTPHPSELFPGEEIVVARLSVEELAVRGKVAALSEE